MSRAYHTLLSALGVLIGSSTPARSASTRSNRKSTESTNNLVVCVHCNDKQCEPGKGCGAKAQAIFTGWKKLNEREFLCPECRKETDSTC